MEKAKRIDASVFACAVNADSRSKAWTGAWNGIEVDITPTLPLMDVLTFVDTVVKTCFSEIDGAYMPEVKDFAIKKCILEMYANFTLPGDVAESYALIYESDAVDFVLQHINSVQFEEIIQSADEKIRHLAQANIETAYKQLDELYDAFDNLQNQIANAFSGINAEEINMLANVLTSGQIDEGKIAEALIKKHKSDKIKKIPKDGE